MPKIMVELSREEIQQQIPYLLICETTSRSVWNAGKRKRLWKQRFTESEQIACNRLIAQSKQWGLRTGVPDKIVMCLRTIDLWNRLAGFCLEVG